MHEAQLSLYLGENTTTGARIVPDNPFVLQNRLRRSIKYFRNQLRRFWSRSGRIPSIPGGQMCKRREVHGRTRAAVRGGHVVDRAMHDSRDGGGTSPWTGEGRTMQDDSREGIGRVESGTETEQLSTCRGC